MKTSRCHLIFRSLIRIIAVLTCCFLHGAFAQDCANVAGTWHVEESATITYSIDGESETAEGSYSGEVTIEQNGCEVRWYTEGISLLGETIALLREGTVTHDRITFSGQMGGVLPEARYSKNLITGNGVIEGNTMKIDYTGEIQCTVEGISVNITQNGEAIFTRSGPKEPFWKVNTIDIDYSEAVQIKKDNKIVINPVWKGEFDNITGDLISEINKPIADDMKSKKYKLYVKLKSYQEEEPKFTPTVKYEYKQQAVFSGDLSFSDADEFTGSEGTIEIKTPQNIGEYVLELDFNIYDGDTFISSQPTILLILYVTLGQPKGSPPKVEWLEKAVLFCEGANTEPTVKSKLVTGIHNKAADQEWGYDGGEYALWQSLVEDDNDVGNCKTYAEMWDAFVKILGVGGTDIISSNGLNHVGFVTIKNLEALGVDNQCGNARPPNSDDNDRWWFGIHFVGIEDGIYGHYYYYDPTFGNEWDEWHFDDKPLHFIEWDGVECDPDTNENCNQVRRGWFNDPDGLRQNLTGGHYIYDKIRYYEYHSPGLSDVGPAGGNATFTDVHVATPMDDDGDGRFDQLLVTVEVDAIEPSDYLVFGCISADGTYITQYATNDSTYPISCAITDQSGIVGVELGFSGEHIGNSGIDGPYTVTLELFDANGFYLDETSFETTYYVASQFGEVSAELIDAKEIAIDTNGNFLFDYLLVNADVNVFREGDYYLDATLITADGKGNVSSDANRVLSVGLQSIDVSFDGRQINKVADSNSYTVKLALFDAKYRQQGSFSFVTDVYSPTDFERKDVLITGPYSDYTIDTNENGLSDFLCFEAVLDVNKAGTYNITAWLQDANGFDITYVEDNFDLHEGQQTVVFEFKGHKIYSQQADGPYSVIYLLVENSEGVVDSKREIYSTERYKFTDFDPPISELQEGFETGDFDKFEWISFGDAEWSVTSDEYKSGTHSAQAGLTYDDGSTTLKLTLDCTSGDISFYYKISSEQYYDYLRFYIDGTLQNEWSGDEDWTQVSFPVNAGRRTFEWTYSKDGSASYGSDTAWIDDIVFP